MTAFIFVPLLAMTVLISGAVWCYVAHTFVHIVEETAAGNEDFRGSDEPLMDWLWQSVFVASFVIIWGAPAFLLGQLASHKVAHGWKPYVLSLTIGAVLWFGFPLSFLSSMSSESQWALFSPGLFARLARRAGDAFIYFLLTAIVIAICVPLAPLMVAEGKIYALIPAGIALGLAVVLYSRLTGRMAHVARLAEGGSKKKAKPKPKARVKRPRGMEVIDPWEVPEEVRLEEEAQAGGFVQPSDMPAFKGVMDEDISGYDVSFTDAAKTESTTTDVDDPPDSRLEDGYTTARPNRERTFDAASAITPDPLELSRLTRRKEKQLRHPWLSGVWLFPFQNHAATLWGVLSIEFILIGLLVHGLMATWPWSGAE